MLYTSLENYFRTSFAMVQHHKWSLTEIDSMIPWERDLYVIMLTQHLEEEREMQKRKGGSGLDIE
ncbi:hypothetical protein SWPG_00143 [Synechococcus phage S-CBM2]|nr:hypothetical protein SWPG_00143 [Synechococcus phage S-CBM2]